MSPGRIAAFVLCITYFATPCLAKRPNVLLITVDCLRPDHLSAFGYRRETSPALDRFAQDGVLFQNAVSSSSWTSPGLISVLTGLWAPTHGVDGRGKRLNPETPTMATLLKSAGYAVPDILFLSSIPNFQNLGLSRSYPEREEYLQKGDEVLFRALEFYRDSTFFLFYHYRNLHLPFNPTPPFDRMFTPEGYDKKDFARSRVDVIRTQVTIPVGSVNFSQRDREWIVGLYDGQIREMDETFFGPLYAHLKRLGIYDSTLVIVTADHGEELMDHGFVGHPSTSFKGSAFDEVLRIPLVMTCPSLLRSGRRVQTQVQNVDILPTVLDLLDLSVPGTVQGRSLLPLVRGEETPEGFAFTETTPGGYQATPEMMKTRIRALRSSRWKLIHTHGPEENRYDLYDLERDPGEKQDVSAAHPETVNAMRERLHEWVLSSERLPLEREALSASAKPDALPEPIQVLQPADGDTIRYTDSEGKISVVWAGPSDLVYDIEYRVGEGAYHLEGDMQVEGTQGEYGPYTVEMWDLLTLYNPWSFRVTLNGASASPWITFRLIPTKPGVHPGLLRQVNTWVATWWVEIGLLLGGILSGSAQLTILCLSASVVDLVSIVLVGAILIGLSRPLLIRLGRDRLIRWGLVLAYTAFVYGTLAILPEVWEVLWASTQGRIDYLGVILMLLVGLVFFGSLALRCRKPLPFLSAVPLAAAYTLLLLGLGDSPAERLHLAEYGLLSFLVLSALKIDLPLRRAYVLGWIIAVVLGSIDEGIQWTLPNRVFEWRDIGLNALSSGLGMAVIAIYQSAGRKAVDRGSSQVVS